MNKDRYIFGWTDPKGIYGEPHVEYEPIKMAWWARDWAMAFAHIMLALSLTMVFAPMLWVKLIFWVLA